jgi:hypothetical protein
LNKNKSWNPIYLSHKIKIKTTLMTPLLIWNIENTKFGWCSWNKSNKLKFWIKMYIYQTKGMKIAFDKNMKAWFKKKNVAFFILNFILSLSILNYQQKMKSVFFNKIEHQLNIKIFFQHHENPILSKSNQTIKLKLKSTQCKRIKLKKKRDYMWREALISSLRIMMKKDHIKL